MIANIIRKMSLFSTLENLIVTELEKQKTNIWACSRFKGIETLPCDVSGKLGELLVELVCKTGEIPYVYKGNECSSLADDAKVYDIIIAGKRIEIKTARMGNCGNFQHESLRNDSGADAWLFVDIAPQSVTFSILDSFDLGRRDKHPVLGVTPHLRKKTSNVYKLDFSERVIERSEKAGIAKKFTDVAVTQEVVDFFKSKFTQESTPESRTSVDLEPSSLTGNLCHPNQLS